MQDRYRILARLSVAILLLAGIILLGNAGHPAQAQTAGNAASDLPRTITVVGEGTVNVEPNVARANVGVEVTDTSLQEATQEAAETMEAVIEAITDEDVASKDIQTSDYNINIDQSVRRELGTMGETDDQPVYRVRNIVAVTIRDLDSVGQVLDAAVQAGANNLFGVDFRVSEPDRAQAEARRQAVRDAREKAEALAELHGVAVGEVVSISEVIGGGFTPARFQAEAAAPVGGGAGPIAPGELEVSTRLQVVYALVSETAATRESEAGEATQEEAVREMTPTPTPVSEGSSTSSSSATAVEERTAVEAPRPQEAGPAEVNIIGGNETTLRRFLKRWLAPSYPGGPTKITAVIGALPPELSFDLPTLEDPTVIGTLVRQDERPSTQIILDTEMPQDEVIETLSETLQAQGFQAPAQREPTTVFQSTSPRDFTELCSPDDELAVTFTAFEVTDDTTQVRINIVADEEHGPCGEAKTTEPARFSDRLPTLSPPEDTTVRSSGSSRGSNFTEAEAELISDLSVDELAEHYQDQLANAGWDMTDASQTDVTAWSAWSFTDDEDNDWTATFYLVQRGPESDQYLVMLRAERQ